VLSPQMVTYPRKKRILCGQREIRMAQRERIGATPSGSAHHHGYPLLPQMCDQRSLDDWLIDCIGNPVAIPGDALLEIVKAEEGVVEREFNRRADIPQALRHRFDLGHPQRGMQGVHLAVEVGERNMIHVDQAQLANTRARERFGDPRADAAKASHHHMGLLQTPQSRLAVEPGDSCELALFVDGGDPAIRAWAPERSESSRGSRDPSLGA